MQTVSGGPVRARGRLADIFFESVYPTLILDLLKFSQNFTSMSMN